MGLTYEQAGVNIAESDRLVEHIKKSVKGTYSKRVVGGVGGFGGLFDARFKKYKSPVLVSSVDGVGTKLLVAQAAGRHDTVGQDLVNHCVNDILACGAKPLFFLDYFATGKLNAALAAQVLSGFIKACKENACALIGGETAEMPGLYEGHEYDLSGTIVGIVDRGKIISGKNIRKGDLVIGLPSTGLHTNGYSLARVVLLSRFGIDAHIDQLGAVLADTLLAVHKSYLHPVLFAMEKVRIRGIAHITGGGIIGNTMRILPKGLSVTIDWSAWEPLPIFRLIQECGNVPESDMRRTFNLGIGLTIILRRADADKALEVLRKRGEAGIVIGEVVEGTRHNGVKTPR